MLSNIRTVIRPASLEEALARLEEGGGAVRAVAGGTAISRLRSPKVNGVVDLWPLPLRYVRSDGGGLRIGATATLNDLARSPEAHAFAGGALAEAAQAAASPPVRSLITAGGNLASLYPWSDLPPVLLVLGATVKIAGPAGTPLTVEELVAKHPATVLSHTSLITEIVVPAVAAGSAAAFAKQGETAFDYSLLDVAAFVEMAGGTCRSCRFAIGAIEARCRRVVEVEQAVVGTPLDEAAATAAGDAAQAVVSPIADIRAGAAYRLDLLRVATRRVLLEARSRAVGGAA